MHKLRVCTLQANRTSAQQALLGKKKKKSVAYHNLVVFCVAVTDVVHVTLLSECFSRAALHCAELPCLDTIGKEDRCALVLHIRSGRDCPGGAVGEFRFTPPAYLSLRVEKTGELNRLGRQHL